MKMEAVYSSETPVNFNENTGGASQNMILFTAILVPF
jgi:hypothetical protein